MEMNMFCYQCQETVKGTGCLFGTYYALGGVMMKNIHVFMQRTLPLSIDYPLYLFFCTTEWSV